jgi:hypothetical protein
LLDGDEAVLGVGEVGVELATGNAGPRHDVGDVCVYVTFLGERRYRGAQQPIALLLAGHFGR